MQKLLKRLEKIRVRKGFTVAKLCEMMGVNESTYYRWKAGDNGANARNVERVRQIVAHNESAIPNKAGRTK
jgi:transcriptional regulator with XRE-family HTH domain